MALIELPNLTQSRFIEIQDENQVNNDIAIVCIYAGKHALYRDM